MSRETCQEKQSSTLSQSEYTRYSRHLLLPEVGVAGQEKLKAARVLVVGAGGLGCPVIQYLAAAGVGTLGIVDFDSVDMSNLQRQVLFKTEDVGESKAKLASKSAFAVNPEIKVEVHELKLSEDNVLDIISNYDLVVDGTDNFPARYLINDACVLSGKPDVQGAIYRFDGQVSVFGAESGPCYRCIFPEPPPPEAVPNCAEGGVLGVMAGVIGSIQANEAIKIILDRGSSLSGRLLVFDALETTFHKVKVERDSNCPVCGDNPSITKPVAIEFACTADGDQGWTISASELKEKIDENEPVFILDVRTDQEVAICRIDGAKHIPLSRLEDEIHKLSEIDNIVVYCKSGFRSQNAQLILKSMGFKNVLNLQGGILAWAKEVDSGMTTY